MLFYNCRLFKSVCEAVWRKKTPSYGLRLAVGVPVDDFVPSWTILKNILKEKNF